MPQASQKRKKKDKRVPAKSSAAAVLVAGATSKDNDASSSPSSSPMKRKELPLIPLATILSFTVILPQISRCWMFGPTAILGHAYFDLQKTPLEWKTIIRENSIQILTIGGAHRSGTTLVWDCITNHPEITGFGSEFESGVSFSEGVLMQDVLPQHGVATELAIKSSHDYSKEMVGVGKYALADEESVHLTEQDKRVTVENFARLLNRYGSHWNLTKPVWVDKSPPAAVMSRAFQGIYNINVEGAEEPKVAPTKFLFTTRHPIANAYGHHNLLGGSDVVPFDTLLRNFVQVHKYLMEDMRHLHNGPKLLKLEDFVSYPSKHLTEIFSWLGVDSSAETVAAVLTKVGGDDGIRKNVNEKYRGKWCSIDAFKRGKVAERYQPLIKDLGLDYDLVRWCVD